MSDPKSPTPSPDDLPLDAPPVPAAADGETAPPVLFSPRSEDHRGFPVTAWLIAAGVVIVLIIALVVATHHKDENRANTLQGPSPYAASLPLSQLAMSESTSLSGGKSTYIDGHVRNTGGETITGVTVQVVFANDEAMPPQIETVPLTLIRTREPYVDTQPMSASPLRPGDDREFRLIFESIPQNWNSQMPEIRIIRTSEN